MAASRHLRASHARSLRCNELRRHLGPVTNATPARVLTDLEAAQVIARHDFGEMPPRVEHSLAEGGQRLVPVPDLLSGWGAKQERLLGASCTEDGSATEKGGAPV